jgi:hypothetical protein
MPDPHSVTGYKVLGTFTRLVGKVVQPLQSVKNCYNSCAHGQEWPGPLHS